MAADSSSLHNPSKTQKHQQNASPSSSIIYKAAFVCVLIAILPIFPSGSPESSSTNKTILARGLELLQLLLVGVAISYGLFSRRNSDRHPELDKDDATQLHKPEVAYSVFDDEGAADETWSYSRYNPEEPLVMVAKESGGANGRDPTREEPLFLPVRSLKSAAEGDRVGKEGIVLPSPIPWRSRSSGRMEVKEEPTPASGLDAETGPRRISPSHYSTSSEMKKSFSTPPAPPPPPPPPLPLGHHRYHLGVEKKDGRKSFKDEVELSSNGLGTYGGRSVRTVRPATLPRNESTERNELRAKMVIGSDSEEDDDSESSDAEDLPDSAAVERAGTEEEEEEEENEVDKKADEFIAKFREQIRLQRIASLKRLTEQRTQSDS